jgi:hypothetical protein
VLPNVNLQGKYLPNVASNHWEDSSTRRKSVVEKGKLPNVKMVRHTKNTTVDDVTDLKNEPACLYSKKRGGQNIYEVAWPLFEQKYYIYVTV